MKILWFVNIAFPEVLEKIGQKPSGSGWWLTSLAREMAKDSSIKLTIANCSPAYKSFERFESDGIEFWMIPAKSSNINGYKSGKLVCKLAQLANDSDVDIIDVHGTEYLYGQISPFVVNKPVVITIQGFINEVIKKAFGDKSFLETVMLQTRSFRDIKSLLIMINNYLSMRVRIKSEQAILKFSPYIIGRTDWDKTITYKFNPNRRGYFTCWEIIRPEFYKTAWSWEAKTAQKIFTCGRCEFAKGLDDLVWILPELKSRFPQIELRLTIEADKAGYSRYLARLAKNLGVAERMKFLGYLSGIQIVDELKNASIFAHPSYVDNSPNTIAEAMCIGTPCVASDVGGIPSMIKDGDNGLLFEAGNRKQLLGKISIMLSDRNLAEKLGANARRTALERHDPAKVVRETVEAYKNVLADWNNR
jgi:L-malate glycosyltransferase